MSALMRAALLTASIGLLIVGLTPPRAHADPCAPLLNPISCENSKPGTPQSVWDIPITGSDDGSGAGDSSIQGFATQISVNHGETVHFKVSTTASAYHIDIYRIGWYQGNGARYITTVNPSAPLPQAQPACTFDSTTRLTDCGNWADSATWAVPSDAVSGVYIADLIRDQGRAGMSQIIFVVRADESHSDLLVQTSDETWQAYNRYAGYSLYYPSGSRAYKVSYNRPFTTRGYADESFFFSAEYPMVRWLERNGYDLSYLAGVDTASRPSLLLNHGVFLSVGHDEYWSGEQRTNIEAARAAGVDLAFFSGNEFYWKTRWENSIDGTNTPWRTLVTYKETLASKKIDPSPLWTGSWRDPRFSPPADGGRPENAITGQLFTVDCCSSHDQQIFPITVPADDGKMRLWRGTSVANQPPGGVATLSASTLGYEWDEVVDNGFLPAGIVEMSTSTQYVQQRLIDYGNTYAPGSATHHLTLYKASSDALVFGAGTIRWSWGLDERHDSDVSAVDPQMQQATVNLFADMGVQPGTLQNDLVPAAASTDTTAPVSTVTSPSAGTNVRAESPITITGTASDQGGVVGGVEVSTDGGTTWHPASGRESWTYTWTPSSVPGPRTIVSRAVDDSANLGTPSAGVNVTIVARDCPCSVWSDSTTPGQPISTDSTANELGVKFQPEVSGWITGIRFYKDSTNTGTHIGHLWTRTGTLLAAVTFTDETASRWQQATFSTPVAVTAGTTYVASYFAPNGHYAQDVNYFMTAGQDRYPIYLLAKGVDGANGVYKAGSSGFPSTAGYNSSNYYVDVVFQPQPAPPAGVTTTAPSSSEIDLSWDDVWGESSYKVQRSPDGASNWTQIGTTGPNVTAFADVTASAGTSYSYRVIASNSAGDSVPSTAVTGTTQPIGPTGFTAAAASASEIDLSWTDVAGETSYKVQRSLDGSTGWTQVGTTTANVTTFFDTGLAAATTYSYRVIASNAGGDSSPSLTVSATTYPESIPPGSPSGLTATAASTSRIDLSWTDVAGETSYKVQRSSDGSTGWTQVGTTGADVTTFSDTGLTENTSYWYRVFASNLGGDSDPSNVATATTPLPPPPPAPTSLTATAASTSRIDLSWTDVTGETSYKLQRSPDGSTGWTQVGTTGANVTTFADTGLTAATAYFYRVIASNGGGDSAPSSVATASTLPLPPSAPTGLTATAASTSRIDLAWTDVTGETSYKLQRSPDGSTGWTQVGTTGANVTTFADTGLTAATTYFYRVIASNSGGDSAPSAVASKKTWQFCSCTIWPNTATPGQPANNDSTANELGVKFRSDVNGYVTGVRFYKGSTNTGTHVGHLWTRSGTLLATVTFSSETASGWQQANFSTPLAITAGTTYVVSYFAPNGHFAQDVNYFASSGVDNPPLHALAAGVDGANGVYKGGSSGFPTSSFKSSNYWVDAVFTSVPQPSGLTATAASSSEIDLSWTDVTGETSYKLQRSSDGSTGWTQVGTTGANVTTFADTGLTAGTTYFYRVIASNGGGDSAPSSVATASTLS